MFKYEEKTIYVTRGDIGSFEVSANLKAGDIVRFKVTAKKNCEKVVCQRDFEVSVNANSIEIILDDEATRIGEVISKPTDYWYEVELNPDTDPQTIIGYDEDGAKILRLFPEGADVNAEDIEVVGKKTLDDLVDDALLKAKEDGAFKGEKGDKGDKGEKGDKGDKGEKGDKGDKGDFEYSEEIALIAKDPNNDGNVILTYGGVIGGDPVPGLTEAEVQAMIDAALAAEDELSAEEVQAMIDAALGAIANGSY